MTKVCTKCKQELVLEQFYRDRSAKDGRTCWCKACTLAARAIERERDPERLRERSRSWYHANKAQANADNRRYQQRNQGYRKVYNRQWDNSHPELRRAREERYVQKHGDKIKTRKKIGQQARRQADPEKYRAKSAQNRTKRLQAPGTCTKQQWLAKINYHGWRCFYCKLQLTPSTMHMDHRKPLSRGGSHWPANLVPSCASCNLSKGGKTEIEFLRHISSKKLSISSSL